MNRRLFVPSPTEGVHDVPFAVNRIIQLFLFMTPVSGRKRCVSAGLYEEDVKLTDRQGKMALGFLHHGPPSRRSRILRRPTVLSRWIMSD